jgi:hypothetical protein
MVVALIALFIAMGGTSYAVVSLPRNSVGAPQIKTNAVGPSEIRRNAVGLSEITPSAENALEGRIGPQGIQGIHGVQGERGEPGPPGFDQLTYVGGIDTNFAGEQEDVFAVCPEGTRPTGGGGGGDSTVQGEQAVNFSGPAEDAGDPDDLADGWIVFVDNNSATDYDIYAFATCAPTADAVNAMRPVTKVRMRP